MTIKQLIENLQTIADCYGDTQIQLSISDDCLQCSPLSSLMLDNHDVSFLIALDNLLDDKNDDKLVIKID